MSNARWRSWLVPVLALTSIPALLAPTTAGIRVVTDCADTGGSDELRALVAAATAGDTLLLPACTIELSSTLLITKPLVLQGAGAARTAISGKRATQVVKVTGAALDVTLADLTIRDGLATINDGGGLESSAAFLTLRGVSVTGNAAPLGVGGGVVLNGPAVLIETAVSGNTAGFGGGGIFSFSQGSLTVVRSTVSGNATTEPNSDGGGGINMFNGAGTATLVNSTVSGNTVAGTLGGGGVVTYGQITLLSTTVVGNQAPAGPGGGILRGTPIGSSVHLHNTIIAGNTASSGRNCEGVVESAGHNLEDDVTCGLAGPADQSDTDPDLGPLQDNGGPTATHALRVGSAAIDAGDLVGCPATDQRGRPRPRDGDRDQAARCDVGAYELSPVVAGRASP